MFRCLYNTKNFKKGHKICSYDSHEGCFESIEEYKHTGRLQWILDIIPYKYIYIYI
jgi:hypothetical protein